MIRAGGTGPGSVTGMGGDGAGRAASTALSTASCRGEAVGRNGGRPHTPGTKKSGHYFVGRRLKSNGPEGPLGDSAKLPGHTALGGETGRWLLRHRAPRERIQALERIGAGPVARMFIGNCYFLGQAERSFSSTQGVLNFSPRQNPVEDSRE